MTKEVPCISEEFRSLPFSSPADNLDVEGMMSSFIESVCLRLEASDSLYKQVKTLHQRSLLVLPNLTMPTCKISSCAKISESQYKGLLNESNGNESLLNALSYEDLTHATFLRVHVSNGERSNEVLIYLSTSYPLIPPIFSLISIASLPSVPSFVKG